MWDIRLSSIYITRIQAGQKLTNNIQQAMWCTIISFLLCDNSVLMTHEKPDFLYTDEVKDAH